MASLAFASMFGVGVTLAAGGAPAPRANDEANEVSYLIAAGTADSLATASLLSHLIDTPHESDVKPDSSALIQRAVSLAPQRPELLWLQLRDCELRHCAEEPKFLEQLRAVDPDNGWVLLPALSASLMGTPQDTTKVIAQIGAAKHLTLYWNKSVVAMFDALTHLPKSRPATALTHDADDRLAHVTGVLAAIDLPPFRPITRACASEQFKETGRREACESLMNRLDQSDTIIAQSLSLSMRQKWASPGTAEAIAWSKKSLQQRYLVEASGRARGAKVNDDAIARVDAMRHLATEEDVDKAMLRAFNEPLERPVDWQGASAPN
jgi:hypothetical protein